MSRQDPQPPRGRHAGPVDGALLLDAVAGGAGLRAKLPEAPGGHPKQVGLLRERALGVLGRQGDTFQ